MEEFFSLQLLDFMEVSQFSNCCRVCERVIVSAHFGCVAVLLLDPTFSQQKSSENPGDDDDDGGGNGDWRLFRPQLHLSEMIEERQKITPAVGASQWTLITSEKQTFNYCV